MRRYIKEREAAGDLAAAEGISKVSHLLRRWCSNVAKFRMGSTRWGLELVSVFILQTKNHVQGILDRNISRAENNYRLAAKLEQIIGEHFWQLVLQAPLKDACVGCCRSSAAPVYSPVYSVQAIYSATYLQCAGRRRHARSPQLC